MRVCVYLCSPCQVNFGQVLVGARTVTHVIRLRSEVGLPILVKAGVDTRGSNPLSNIQVSPNKLVLRPNQVALVHVSLEPSAYGEKLDGSGPAVLLGFNSCKTVKVVPIKAAVIAPEFVVFDASAGDAAPPLTIGSTIRLPDFEIGDSGVVWLTVQNNGLLPVDVFVSVDAKRQAGQWRPLIDFEVSPSVHFIKPGRSAKVAVYATSVANQGGVERAEMVFAVGNVRKMFTVQAQCGRAWIEGPPSIVCQFETSHELLDKWADRRSGVASAALGDLEQAVVFRNTGDIACTVSLPTSGPVVCAPDAAVFTLGPAASQTTKMFVTLPSLDPFTTTVTVQTSSKARSALYIPLSVIIKRPALKIVPVSVCAGAVSAGHSRTLTFSVSNEGTSTGNYWVHFSGPQTPLSGVRVTKDGREQPVDARDNTAVKHDIAVGATDLLSVEVAVGPGAVPDATFAQMITVVSLGETSLGANHALQKSAKHSVYVYGRVGMDGADDHADVYDHATASAAAPASPVRPPTNEGSRKAPALGPPASVPAKPKGSKAAGPAGASTKPGKKLEVRGPRVCVYLCVHVCVCDFCDVRLFAPVRSR